jgi:16S rRNA (cytosine1402-N4)-methyltransferase
MDSLLFGMESLGHVPVLVREVVEALAPRAGETFLDCTAGLGGHASAIAPHIGPHGTVILNDLDSSNLKRAETKLHESVRESDGIRVVALRGNFAEAPRQLQERGLRAHIVLADLGFSSNQVDDASRGFSFMREGPLDMRLDPSAGVSAAELVRSLPEGELVRIIREYGEDRAAGAIARKIVQARGESPITTTARLAEVVRAAYGAAADRQAIHPATRTFQALRIAVNDELGSLEALVHAIARGAKGADGWLADGARVGIITFHSLEDRIVKRGFAEIVKDGSAEPIGKGPIEADGEEVSANVRARSAKLRVIRVGRIVDSLSGVRRG